MDTLYRFGFGALHEWIFARAGFLVVSVIFLATWFAYIVGALYLLPLGKMKSVHARLIYVAEGLFAALFARFGLVEFIRLFIPTTRPYVTLAFTPLIEPVLQLSFPSGHVAVLSALAFVALRTHRKYGLFLLLCAVLVGAARVLVGVHYPMDIIGGLGVGFVAAFLIHTVFQVFLKGNGSR